tara:strand:- start:1265 stop:2095 length:831 start_codon:yes stop_codon:yes gene_type:complete
MQLIFIKKDMRNNPKKRTIIKLFYSALKLYRVWTFTAWARTEERFARTTLGSIWLGLSNLISIALLSAVYGTVFKVENFKEYVVYLGLGMVLWSSLSTSIGSSPNILLQNEIKIKNTNTNILFYPLEEWWFQLHNFFQSFAIVFLGLIFFNKGIAFNFIFYSTLPLINFLIFMFWFPFLICLLGVRYRDVYQLIPILLQLTFLLSPILYMKENLGKLIWIVNLNPIYLIISQFRDSILSGNLNFLNSLTTLLINFFGITISLLYLKNQKNNIPFLL